MADSLFDDQSDKTDYLATLTGPGGKYDRTRYASEAEMFQAIAKGKVFADRTLEHKNQEFDQLRDEYVKVNAQAIAGEKFQELVTKYENRGNPDNNQQLPPADKTVAPTIDPNKIAEVVAAQVREIKAKELETENLNKVEQSLRERFGDNAQSILKEKMNALNLTQEDVKLLAKRSPEAVLNTLGLNQQRETYQSPPQSSVRSDSFKPTTEIRDAVYYEKLRQSDPKTYFSPKMSVQRLKDMEDSEFMVRYNQQQRRTNY